MLKASTHSVDLVLVVPYQEMSTFGVRGIGSYLKQKGYSVTTVFFKRRNQEDTVPTDSEVSILVDLVKSIDPLLVGFSVMSPFNNVSRMLTRRIRDEITAPIIWGGGNQQFVRRIVLILPISCVLERERSHFALS